MITHTDLKISKSPTASVVAVPSIETPLDELHRVVAPVFEAAAESSSLIAHQHPLKLRRVPFRLPKFILLGSRGGGKPMNIGLFAGFEQGNLEATRALTESLLRFRTSPSLTRDYALSTYPMVNLQGLSSIPALGDFEERYTQNATDEDVQFFLREFRLWNFDGFISVRLDTHGEGFHVKVRSDLIAREVVEPAIAAASIPLPLAAQPVRLQASHIDGQDVPPRLAPPPDVRSQPFDLELYLPPIDSPFEQAEALYQMVAEILRYYRTFISHASEL